jgi:hypothetical protein
MYREKLADIRPIWVAAGWFVSIATASLIGIVLAALGLAIGADGGNEALWSVVVVALGFWVGGFFTGFRALRSPVLHGVAIGLASLVAWLVVNLLAVPFTALRWEGLTPGLTAALLLVQMMSAVGGAWAGHRVALTGGAGLNA